MELKLVFSIAFLFCLYGVSSSSHYFTLMFSFGDSCKDTGNFTIMATPVMPVWIDKPPYGMTFFGHPTGRRLINQGTVYVIMPANQPRECLLIILMLLMSPNMMDNNGLDCLRDINRFTAGGIIKACCGNGGPYNWNGNASCGTASAVACEDPSMFVHWDGGHYTEAIYRYSIKGWLYGPY
uniref:Wall-associated receptor kinase galacturonan-binding domain-containing protein n=1 Tax=Oryza punctata TaxID=4537 RepID=A0A0E0JIW2_ORYPU